MTRGPGGTVRWAALLSDAFRAVRAGGPRLIALMLGFQLLIVVLAFPALGWLFREALRASGLAGLDFAALAPGPGLPLTAGLLLLIGVAAMWIVTVQFTVVIIVLRRAWDPAATGAASRGTARSIARDIVRDTGRVARKLLRPSSFPLALYLFLVLPLTGFGFTSVLAQGIAIPPFISGELAKSPGSAAALTLLLLALALLNVRLALTLPLFATTTATGGRALRLSWRLTRGFRGVPLVGAVLTILIGASLVTGALLIVGIAPTAIADEIAPAASPAIAAYSLGAAQLAGAVLTALVTSGIAAVLLSFLDHRRGELPTDLGPTEPVARDAGGTVRVGARGPEDATDPATATTADAARRRARRRRESALLAGALALAIVALGTAALGTMRSLAAHPDTLVLAHRGFDGDGSGLIGGVENTLSGLEAAAAAGADLVEMDVMQSADGGFVAMHDAVLTRLAGRDDAVKDLTLAELAGITVRDSAGHSDVIPSFRAYVERAAELEMTLLIEIKLGGGDTPDHVDRLVAELESIGALQSNLYHSLDRESVARLKQLRPDVTVGYTMPFAGGGIPDTPADFIVVEEWTATPEMQATARAAGLGFMAWTVNEISAQREHLRRASDGIITDRPDTALAARTEMQDQTGLADTLVDAFTRFVVVF